MKNIYYVYAHLTPLTNELFYFGKGKNQRAWISSNRNNYWINKVKKQNGFTVKIIDENLSEEQAFELEEFCIDFFRNKSKLVNMTNGGEGTSGRKLSSESIDKIRKANIGRMPSDKARQASKLRLLGKNKSDKEKDKIRDNNLYFFYNFKTGETVISTRQYMSIKYKIHHKVLCKLFLKNPRKQVLGWTLIKNIQITAG